MGSCVSAPQGSSVGPNNGYQNIPPQPAYGTAYAQNPPPMPVMPSAPNNDLPPGWVCQYDSMTRHLFYINTMTHERQWEHPNGAAATATDSAQFRQQMTAYEQNVASYNRMYGVGATAGTPQMSQQNSNQGNVNSNGGGRGGGSGVAKGVMLGVVASNMARNSRRRRARF
ncbi:hypothetical protein BGZ70_008246 [Mortierella alpina]|uniref:WW domain-containing protein n=1 Tax=Mortierella alpina TaxID=64518 RepID=A0A9P6J3Y0_MORAP|nr:hypothetical protein BGZ70_008246 [Mortierella alpina]